MKEELMDQCLEKLEIIERRVLIFIIGAIITFLIIVTLSTIDLIKNNHTKVIDGHYTITYIKDGVKCQYKTNRINFHDQDNMISFHDAISGNEVMLNHYVIEVEDYG